MAETIGTVYILANSQTDDLVKVGKSVRVETRLSEINSGAGVIGRWRKVGSVVVSNMDALESACHKALATLRDANSVGTEIFRCSHDTAASTIRAILAAKSEIKVYEDNLGIGDSIAVSVVENTVLEPSNNGVQIIERFVMEHVHRLVYQDQVGAFLHPSVNALSRQDNRQVPDLVGRICADRGLLIIEIQLFKQWSGSLGLRESLDTLAATLKRSGYRVQWGQRQRATLAKNLPSLTKDQKRVIEIQSAVLIQQLFERALKFDGPVAASTFVQERSNRAPSTQTTRL